MQFVRLQDACSHHRDPYPISLRNQGTFTLPYDAVPFDYNRCYVHCATRTRLSTRNPLIGSGVGLPGFNSPDVPPRESRKLVCAAYTWWYRSFASTNETAFTAESQKIRRRTLGLEIPRNQMHVSLFLENSFSILNKNINDMINEN